MGQTLKPLANKDISNKTIFNNRFVVECCEAFHVHYRNLRIVLSEKDFVSMASGMKDALERWTRMGSPATGDCHIELCRKEVAKHPIEKDSIRVNLNNNLYPKNEGKIFAEGADFEDERYIHLKIRDLRLEMSLSEFNELVKTLNDAQVEFNAINV